MQFWRFLANDKITIDKLIAGWSDRTRPAAAGRHVLAIQDTSEIKFSTTPEERRGLGKIKKGNVHGVLLHAMIGVDADSGSMLGLVDGQVWTRKGDVGTSHAKRTLADKESARWIVTADKAKRVLAEAATITIVADRESDFYAHWSLTPDRNVHLLTRMMHDHAVVHGGTVRAALAELPVAGHAVVELRQRADRRPRSARLSIRFASLQVKRPSNCREIGLPKVVALNVVEVREERPPANAEPVHWILLTTHDISSSADALRVVEWYQRRWIIEQFFRTLKRQGFRIEDSQIETADRLCKLVAIAAKAAAIVIQLVQGRDGHNNLPASLVFTAFEIKVIGVLNADMQGKTQRQKNHHPGLSLAWAAWVIAKLGGWHEYEANPPGPITFFNGLAQFQTYVRAFRLV